MSIVIIQLAKDPVGQIAQALLDATARPLEYATPDGRADPRSTCARRSTRSWASPADYADAPRRLARSDAGLFSDLLTRMAARLPHALVLIIDQAEELFTLARTPDEIAIGTTP